MKELIGKLERMKRSTTKVFIKDALSGLRRFLADESSFKMMKNAFHFTLKAFFVLKVLRFCLDFLVIYKNGLIRKMRLQYTYCSISQEVKTIRQ